MSALEAGSKAPEIQLPTTGGDTFTLSNSLRDGRVLLVFFKISCPVCQFAMPYAERLFRLSKGHAASVVAVSQDDQKATLSFMKQYGLTMPVALDDDRSYAVSNAYGLTNVPSFFLVNRSGEIEIASVGWIREDIENIYRALMDDPQPAALFKVDERVPELKFG